MNEQHLTIASATRLVATGGKAEILYLLEHEVRAPAVEIPAVRKLYEEACRKLLAFGRANLGYLDLARVYYCPHIPRALQEEAGRFLADFKPV